MYLDLLPAYRLLLECYTKQLNIAAHLDSWLSIEIMLNV
jgi:hypothetical protein